MHTRINTNAARTQVPTYVESHGKLFNCLTFNTPSPVATSHQMMMSNNVIDPALLSICTQSGVSLPSVFPGLVDTLMPTQFLQQQSSPFPLPSPGVQDAIRNAFWYAFANTMQTKQQYQQQLQLLKLKPAPRKRKRKKEKKKTLSKKIMPVRSKSFRDVRPYHLETRARILFSCLYHWFWGVDQLNPFIDTEIIFQKMMIIPRTRQLPSPCEDENCTLRRGSGLMFKYDKRHRDALRRVILGIEEKDDEKENEIEKKRATEKVAKPNVKRKRPYVMLLFERSYHSLHSYHQRILSNTNNTLSLEHRYVLPKGWTAVIRLRKNGSKYKIYIDPNGMRHRT